MEATLITTLVAFCFAALGYFGRRWIEQQGRDQSLSRTKQILEINRQLTEQNLTPEDLKRIERLLLDRADRNIKKNIEPTPLEKEFSKRVPNHRLTKIAMDALAADKLIDANSDLACVGKKIKEVVISERFNQFLSAQELWDQSCGETAEFVASKFGGGSIRPYIYLIERERLVRERIAQLERVLDDEIQI